MVFIRVQCAWYAEWGIFRRDAPLVWSLRVTLTFCTCLSVPGRFHSGRSCLARGFPSRVARDRALARPQNAEGSGNAEKKLVTIQVPRSGRLRRPFIKRGLSGDTPRPGRGTSVPLHPLLTSYKNCFLNLSNPILEWSQAGGAS